jgi:hypothetical protein
MVQWVSYGCYWSEMGYNDGTLGSPGWSRVEKGVSICVTLRSEKS